MTVEPPLDKRRLALLLTGVAAFSILGWVAMVVAPTLVNDHPAALLALDARSRHLVLAVAADIDPIPYFVIGLLRLLASDPIFYFLGYWYGDAALRWYERQTNGNTGWVGWVERAFRRWGWPLVAIMPNNVVCLLAGQSRMTPRSFLALNIGGTVARLVLLWFLAEAFEEPLDEVLDFIQRYQWWLVGAFFLLAMIQGGRSAAKGQIETPLEASEELVAEYEAQHRADPADDPGTHDA